MLDQTTSVLTQQPLLPTDGGRVHHAVSDSDNLKALAAQINSAYKAAEREDSKARAHDGSAVAHALKAGAALRQVKASKEGAHRKFLPWIRANCDMSVRTAQAYMRLSEYVENHPEDRDHILGMSLRAALALPTPRQKRSAALLDERDMKRATHLGVAARMKSDEDKLLAVSNALWVLGDALERAPMEKWLQHAQPYQVEHLSHFLQPLKGLIAIGDGVAARAGDGRD